MRIVRVLFVCTGNICRSPYAERLACRLDEPQPDGHGARQWAFASAGIAGLEGSSMDDAMAMQLRARGGSADGFRARYLTREIAHGSDLLLAMEPVHRHHIVEEWPELARRTWLLGHAARVASGPHGGDLLAALQSRSEPVRPSDAIADPYRRGVAAAAAAASQIESALRSILQP